jgi:hypothetical protein
MNTRREVLKGGLGLFAYGVAGKALGSTSVHTAPRLGDMPMKATRPLSATSFDPKPRIIDGFPVRRFFEGDNFDDGNAIPFHSAENVFPGGEPPEPTETIDVAVVGGGISGLTTAHLLRERNPVVFELHTKFGGNAQGGTINGAEYTLGSAYVITPDKGGFIDKIYCDLGLDKVARVDADPAPVSIGGKVNPDIWAGMGVPAEDIPAYEAYRALVNRMANKDYPDVPFAEPWTRELDLLPFRAHIEQEMGLPVPPALAAAIQAYCYSSFAGGWEELSAASGWNFLAAEEFGRWVFPGGNAWMADALWQRLMELDQTDQAHAPHLRPGCRVVDVRVRADKMTQVTWKQADGAYRSLLARRVVMSCPKHVCRQVLHQLEERDNAKYNASHLQTRSYAMANVVVDRPIPREFYDIFLLGKDPATFPMNDGEASRFWKYTDVLDGSFSPSPTQGVLPNRPSVLSLYWPLPYDTARFDLLLNDPIGTFGAALAPQLRETLALVGLPEESVREVRFARWGHALPLARRGFIASGAPEELIRPFEGSVYFVHQDNWALPAVENSLYDAVTAAEAINADLG